MLEKVTLNSSRNYTQWDKFAQDFQTGISGPRSHRNGQFLVVAMAQSSNFGDELMRVKYWNC